MRLAGSWHDHEMAASDLDALGLIDDRGRPIGRTLATIRCAECDPSTAKRVGAVAQVDGVGPVAYSDGTRDDALALVRWSAEPSYHRGDFDDHPLLCHCPRHGAVAVDWSELRRWWEAGGVQRAILAQHL